MRPLRYGVINLLKMEFKRYFFSKKTFIIIFLLLILGLISFYVSYNDKQSFINTLSMNYEDIDNIRMQELISNYNGIKFVIDFMLQSDFFQMYVIILFLFFGVFLAPTLHNMIESGQENFILSRTSYKRHAEILIKSQSAYIASIVGITMVILAIIGYIVGGIGSGIGSIGEYTFGIWGFLLICIIHILLTITFTVLVNGLCLFSNVVIKDKYFIQSLPFALFIMTPIIISSTLGNIIAVIGHVFGAFVPFTSLSVIYWTLQYRFDFSYLFVIALPYVFYVFLLIKLYKNNIKNFSKDCL